MNVWSARIRPAVALLTIGAAAALPALPAGAQSPSPQATPAPSGTPWPAPTGVRLEGHAVLLDANNFPLPPEKQEFYFGISWDVLSGFAGVYEVQHAVRQSGAATTTPLAWQPVASGPFPASAAVGGRIGFEEKAAEAEKFLVHCYRVRTAIDAAPGPETGPYSEPVCSVAPPSSGPGTATVAPQPPVVGNTAPRSGEPVWPAWAAVVVSVAFLGLGGFAARRGRASRFGR